MVLALGVGLAAIIGIHEARSTAAVIVAFLAGFGASRWAEATLARRRAARERRWLGALGVPFDADRYLRDLSRLRYSGAPVVRLTFAGACAPTAASALARAAVSPPITAAEWAAGAPPAAPRLRLEARVLDCVERAGPGISEPQRGRFNNAALHRCVRAVLRETLPRLRGLHPVARLEVEIRGEVLAAPPAGMQG